MGRRGFVAGKRRSRAGEELCTAPRLGAEVTAEEPEERSSRWLGAREGRLEESKCVLLGSNCARLEANSLLEASCTTAHAEGLGMK
jgi:hypothetical protein